MKVAVVKYNAGNIRSVDYALKRLGVEAVITADKEELQSADKVIFPGVGEAETTMNHLKATGLDELIKNLGKMAEGIEEQARQSLENIKHILEEAGLTMGNIVKTTVFLQDMSFFAGMNGVYATYFDGAFPARSAVAVKALPKDALVEIECIAVR